MWKVGAKKDLCFLQLDFSLVAEKIWYYHYTLPWEWHQRRQFGTTRKTERQRGLPFGNEAAFDRLPTPSLSHCLAQNKKKKRWNPYQPVTGVAVDMSFLTVGKLGSTRRKRGYNFISTIYDLKMGTIKNDGHYFCCSSSFGFQCWKWKQQGVSNHNAFCVNYSWSVSLLF